MEPRKKLTLDEVQQTQEYAILTPKQQLFVASYIQGGMQTGIYDPVSAVQLSYHCENPESARVMSYAMMNNIRIIEALNRHFNSEPIESFLKEVSRAIRNKKLSVSQVQALKLKADLLGFAARLPGASHQSINTIPKDVIAASKAARKAKRKTPVRKPREIVKSDPSYGF